MSEAKKEPYTVIVLQGDRLWIHRKYQECSQMKQERSINPQYDIGCFEPSRLDVVKGSETLDLSFAVEVKY